MDRVYTVTHKGQPIIVVDLSSLKSNEAVVVLDEGHRLIASMPPKSALVLVDVTDCLYNTDGANALKIFAQKNTPFIKASTSVGARGLRLLLHQAAAVFAGREIKASATRAEAMDWLVACP